MVTGEAGIGKSRLVAEVVADAVSVLTGCAVPVTGPAVAYGPWLRILREIGDPLAAPGSASSIPDTSPRLETTRAARLDHCCQLLSIAAYECPMTIVLEDLHWADEASLELLAFVVRRWQHERVLILATFRTDDPAAEAAWPPMAELQRCESVYRLHLDPLPLNDLSTIVRQSMALTAADPAAGVDRIITDSGGNTFLAVELAKATSADRLPRHLADIMASRLYGLPSRTTSALQALAVLGRPATHRELELIVLAAGEPVLSGDSLLLAVRGDILLVNSFGTSQEYAYRHGLMIGLVLGDLMPGDRLRWHRAVAEALGSFELAHLTSFGEVGEHWFLADMPEQALRSAVVAGIGATAVVAPDQARRHTSRALLLWDRVADPVSISGIDLWELRRLAAAACRWCGDLPAAVTLVELALAAGADDAAIASLLERLGRYRYESGDAAAAMACYIRAAELLGAGSLSELHATVTAAIASLHSLSGHHRIAVPAAHRAAAEAETVGAPAQQSYALTTAGMSESELGLAKDAVADLMKARSLAESCGDIEGRLRAEAGLCVALDRLGELEPALVAAKRGLEITTSYQLGANLGLITLANVVDLMRLLGRWAEADQLLTSRTDGSAATQHRSFLLVMRAQLRLPCGRFDEVAADLDEADSLLDLLPQPAIAVPFLNTRAELALWSGIPSQAWDFIERALDVLAALDEPQLVAWTCALGMRAIADDERHHRRDHAGLVLRQQRAAQLLDAARQVAAEPGLGPQGKCWLTVLGAEHDRYRAVAAPPSWQDAADQWHGLHRPYDRAYALYRLAESFAGSGERRRAAAALDAGMTIAGQLAARPLLAEMQALAKRSRIGGAPAPAAASALKGSDLTAREIEVLKMVSEGRSNRQIARELFISEKTVSVHVSHVLTKLHAGTRTEAAWVANQRGLLDSAERAGRAPDRR